MWVLNLTFFSRSQRSKFKISPSGRTFCYYWTWRAVVWCDDVSRPLLYYTKFWSDRIPSGDHGALVKSKSTISWVMVIALVTKFSLMRLRRMYYTCLFSLNFQGHRYSTGHSELPLPNSANYAENLWV